MDSPALVASFSSPPVEYRPAPFFVLNDEHEGQAGEARITTVLEAYRRIGFGGAFLHPRPGLITEYLSPRWFELIRHAVRECHRLGLVPYLYDENSYPSGVGGGHVPTRAPETRTRYVAPVFGDRPWALPDGILALHRWEGDRPGEAIAKEALTPGQPWIAFVMGNMDPTPWHGETVCPSLLNPRTIETFLETTHQAYRRELGDLWSALPAIFTDEPHLPAQGHGPWSQGLHLTPFLFGEFERRCGYDLRPHLASLFFDVGDHRAVRYDLYDLMHRLWVENWALPLEAWCDGHGIALTGHYLEHDWPSPYATPGQMHMLAHMHWPGTDMLETFLLTGHDFHDVQNFAPAPDGQEPHGLFYLRQAHSIANQLNKPRVLDECWGAGGHDSTPADWSRIGRWLIVHGVNLLNPHLSMLTVRGTRKADHPQTFSDHSAWFEHLRDFNDELTRLAWIANQGRTEQRVLVLDPVTTGFCVSSKSDGLPASPGGGDEHSAAEPPTEERFRQTLASGAHLRQDIGEIVQGLSDAQADFDIGDEYVLEEFGRVDGGTLAVGAQSYGLLVWPGSMTNLRAATAAMLERYLGSGGQLVGVRPDEVTIDGRPADFLRRCDEHYAEQCQWLDSNRTVIEAVLAEAPPRLQVEAPPATGLAHMRRVMPDAEAFLVVNSSAQPVDSPARFETRRRRLYELDPASGRCSTLDAEDDSGSRIARLRVEGRGAAVILATDDDLPTARRSPAGQFGRESVTLEPTKISRSEPNVLVIDSCELEMRGKFYEREAVYATNERLWRAHGFETNGWFGVIQYRDQILAANRRQTPDTGGAVTYRFQLADGLPTEGIRLAVELPELWRITVNDRAVDLTGGERWLDDHIRALAIGDCLHPGDNTVRLEGRPFDVRREIDQIYLLGDFACQPAEPGFRLEPARPLGLGSWRAQGCPFYDRAVAYQFELPADSKGVLSLDADDWSGSFLVVEQNGGIVARLWEPPYRVELDPAQGSEVTLRVIGLPKNLLGPWHAPGAPRRRAWMPMWYGADVPTDPQPGERYDLLDLGLFQSPRWHAAT